MMTKALDDLAFIHPNGNYPHVRNSRAYVCRRLRAATGHQRMFAADMAVQELLAVTVQQRPSGFVVPRPGTTG